MLFLKFRCLHEFWGGDFKPKRKHVRRCESCDAVLDLLHVVVLHIERHHRLACYERCGYLPCEQPVKDDANIRHGICEPLYHLLVVVLCHPHLVVYIKLRADILGTSAHVGEHIIEFHCNRFHTPFCLALCWSSRISSIPDNRSAICAIVAHSCEPSVCNVIAAVWYMIAS